MFISTCISSAIFSIIGFCILIGTVYDIANIISNSSTKSKSVNVNANDNEATPLVGAEQHNKPTSGQSKMNIEKYSNAYMRTLFITFCLIGCCVLYL